MARRLFLERRSYRRNRLQDAARMVPVLGVVLIFGPLFIRGDANAEETTSLARGLVYYFAIWVGLIALSAWVSRALVRSAAADETDLSGQSGEPAQGPPR